jgi:hypothetical protein
MEEIKMSMNLRRLTITIGLILMLALVPLSVFAGTDSSGGITLTFPDNMVKCDPTFDFTTTGVDPSWEVWYDIFVSEAGNLVKVGGGKTFGDLNVSFTPDPLSSGETRVYAIFVAVFVPGQERPTKLSGQWRVDCDKEPPGGGEGCTPGFWKTHPDVWPIPTDTDFDTTFGVDAFDPDITMFDAVNLKGGQLRALSRHAAGAYLNAVSPVVNFDLSAAEVIAAYQAAFASGDYNTTKNMFEALNEQGCPY